MIVLPCTPMSTKEQETFYSQSSFVLSLSFIVTPFSPFSCPVPNQPSFTPNSFRKRVRLTVSVASRHSLELLHPTAAWDPRRHQAPRGASRRNSSTFNPYRQVRSERRVVRPNWRNSQPIGTLSDKNWPTLYSSTDKRGKIWSNCSCLCTFCTAYWTPIHGNVGPPCKHRNIPL